MLSDDELREVLIDEARSMAEEAGENPNDMTVDEDSLATLMLAGRAVERAVYERAAKECMAQKGGLSSEWGDGHDTGCDDCFAAIRALGRQQ